MNDKTIIKSISTIYFIIVSLLTFIFLTLSVTFIILQNGLNINDISTPNIKIKQLYIKWNEKLSVSVKEIKLSDSQESDGTLDYSKLNDIFNQLQVFDDWFEQVSIDKITYNDINASFKYLEGKDGFLIASSPTLSLKSSLYFDSNLFNVKIDTFYDSVRDINITGDIIYNGYDFEVASSLYVNIHNDANLNIISFANQEKLFYRVNSLKNIKSIKHIVDIAQLPKEILYWVYGAINMSSVTIKDAYGWMDYKDVDSAYKNLNINARVNKLTYKYDKKLDGIHTTHTNLKFKNGSLYIYPKNATSYGFNLQKSWIKIDFTGKEEILSLKLLFKGMLNKDILGILKRYKIKLPFLQRKGTVDTNLNIDVNLRTIAIDAKGDFFTSQANFDYLGLNIDIYDSYISLDNYDIKINQMLAKYKDIASSKVKVKFNAKSSKGSIKFKVLSANFEDVGIDLKKAVNVTYNISPNNDSIKINPSTWKYAGKDIVVESIRIPFNLKKLMLKVPTTLVKVPGMLSGYVSGKVFLKSSIVDLNIDLLKFTTKSTKLAQSSTQLQFKYDKKLQLHSKEKILFTFNDLECYIDNMKLNIINNIFNINNADVSLEGIGKSSIKGIYNFTKAEGRLHLQKVKLKNKELGSFFANKKKITLDIKRHTNKIDISAKRLNMYLTLTDLKWKLVVSSIYDIAANSKLLSKYNLNKGKLILHKTFKNNYISFTSNIHYPYPILVVNNIPTKEYKLKGTISELNKKVSISVNNVAKIDIDKNVKISLKNAGINIGAFLDFFEDLKGSSSGSSKTNLTFNAKNSYLYLSKDRHVVADSIKLQYYKNITTAQLNHKQGHAGFKLENDNFHLYGDDFGDKFMDELFALSKFKKGAMSFSLRGTTKEYEGIIDIKGTTILDYKILNNILAFVNTIPALVTFSLPGYSSEGLKLENAYMNFTSKDNLFNIQNIYLDSKEIDILGNGTANFKTDEIDLKLNLKTALGDSVSKIPIVGYILLGEDTVSTSLSVTGALSNPDINSLIAKDIAIAPLNILKRALLLPYHLLKGDENKEKNSTEEEVEEVEEEDWY